MERMESALNELAEREVGSWADIHAVLDEFVARSAESERPPLELTGGVAFLTFDYGIDGVTIEIAKYAACLEQGLRDRGIEPVIHCIGGDFHASADQVLAKRWKRKRIDQANGWSKWHGGKWFSRLFFEDMPAGSDASKEMAIEIWRQALGFARELASYLEKHRIGLLIPVNTNSNPGNPAVALATVLVTEAAGLPALDSCHDFFWEAGKPSEHRGEGEKPGARDHFFRNHANASFFQLIERIYPWTGPRWITMVINTLQRDELRRRCELPSAQVIEVGTYIEDEFFIPVTHQRKTELRRHLGYILGAGERMISVEHFEDFEGRIPEWMTDQQPVVLGTENGLSFDLADSNAIWFLQPTRMVPRKRIPRDWDLIETLLAYAPFRLMFEDNPDLTLTLHVTGPVPAEHEADLRDVVEGFRRVLESAPPFIARRLFLAMSAGKLGHSTFQGRGLDHLSIADLYHLADLVLLPSSTEGRGLPILEAAAAGLPVVCSRYHPREVFEALIGRKLKKKRRIRYTRFPEGRFPTDLLQEITDRVFLHAASADMRIHNRCAVAARFSMREVTHTFGVAIDWLEGAVTKDEEE